MIREMDDSHLSISHSSGNVARIYRSDGTLYGNVKDFNGWSTPLGEPECAFLTQMFLQIGLWRLAEFDSSHMSVSHGATGKTAMIYRVDGTRHPGPRKDFNAFDIARGTFIEGSDKDCVL